MSLLAEHAYKTLELLKEGDLGVQEVALMDMTGSIEFIRRTQQLFRLDQESRSLVDSVLADAGRVEENMRLARRDAQDFWQSGKCNVLYPQNDPRKQAKPITQTCSLGAVRAWCGIFAAAKDSKLFTAFCCTLADLPRPETFEEIKEGKVQECRLKEGMS